MVDANMDIATYCSILTACVSDNGQLLLTVMNDELAQEREQHAVPLVDESGSWSPLKGDAVLPWLAAGATWSNKEVVIVGWGGQVLVVDGMASRREGLVRDDKVPVSIIRSVATIGHEVYAVGMRRQVYMRSAGRWTPIDSGVQFEGDAIDVGFECIAGFNSEEIYAAGFSGALWRYERQKWSEIHSPTNLHLHAICCAPNGNVYVGGRKGVILVGRGDSWDLHFSDLNETIWDLQWFGDRLFARTSKGVYACSGSGSEPVIPKDLMKDEYVKLASTSRGLYVFGFKSILKHDGRVWEELPLAISERMAESPAFRYLNNDAALDEEDDEE